MVYTICGKICLVSWAKKSSTVDGRVAYKTKGGTRTQPVYKRIKGEYARDEHGKLIIEKWRVIRYGWTLVKGRKVKTQRVSVLVDQNPKSMTAAQLRALDRELSDLVTQSQESLDVINAATESLLEAIESDMEPTTAEYQKLTRRVDRLLAQEVSQDAATLRALEAYMAACEQYVVKKKLLASGLAAEIEKEQSKIEEGRTNLEKAGRITSFGVAAISYLADSTGVKAGPATRRVYSSYLRNHILVPTNAERDAIGDLRIPDITVQVLQAFERSLYQSRDGFVLEYSPTDKEFFPQFRAHIEEGTPMGRLIKRHPPIDPRTAAKIITYLSSVIEWAMQDPSRWGLHHYPINIVAKYKMVESSPRRKKDFAPRTAEFKEIVSAAEQLGLSYMIPLLALTRCSFRPSEARALKWSDIREVDVYGKRMHAAYIQGTIQHSKGQGERFVATGKTKAALSEQVVIPESTLELLRKHRVDGCEFVVPPAPVIPGVKNAGHKRKPFLTKDAYAAGWRAIREKVGLPKDTDMYSLKHGLIAELLLKGESPKTICLMTRHTTEEMVKRIYGTIQSGDLANKIDELSETES
jgi:integrase